MIRQIFNAKRRKILIDVNTQNDLLLPNGSKCIKNHRRVLAKLRRIFAWARKRNITIISTSQVFYPDNGADYCLDGTPGQKKITYSLLPNRITFPADGLTYLPLDVLRRHRQIILHKRCTDPFDEPRIERLLTEISAAEFLVVGAPAESAVKAVVLGLLHRRKKVTVVTDAIGSHEKDTARLALRKMAAKGARLIKTKKIAGSSNLKHIGICNCYVCRPTHQKIPLGANLS